LPISGRQTAGSAMPSAIRLRPLPHQAQCGGFVTEGVWIACASRAPPVFSAARNSGNVLTNPRFRFVPSSTNGETAVFKARAQGFPQTEAKEKPPQPEGLTRRWPFCCPRCTYPKRLRQRRAHSFNATLLVCIRFLTRKRRYHADTIQSFSFATIEFPVFGPPPPLASL